MTSTCSLVQDRIAFDYTVNYVFPQYALPWNNFFTRIDEEPFYLRNEQRNTNARLARSPLVIDAKPELVLDIAPGLPDWAASVSPDGMSYISTGTILESVARKIFFGKLAFNGCLGVDYQYSYEGSLAGVNTRPAGSSAWILFQLNLSQKPTGSSLAVVSVSGTGTTKYSTLIGRVVVGGTVIPVTNPTPLGPDNTIPLPPGSNTVYGLYGNRIFIGVLANDLPESSATAVSYSFSFRVVESSAPALAGVTVAAPGFDA
jgi:hypothetical protein